MLRDPAGGSTSATRNHTVMPLITVVLLGFFLGLRHASDADHVIAVSTIVTRQRSMWSAILVGIVWGVGHTLTILVVGGSIILLGLVIPPRVGLAMEFSVALMLILLGLLNLTGIARRIGDTVKSWKSNGSVHSHAHSHDDYVHTHLHGHEPEAHGHADHETAIGRVDAAFGQLGLYRLVRPLIVGVVHGLAGSAGVALLVLAAVPNPRWGIVYLGVFGVGTVVGMAALTAALGLPLAYLARRHAPVHQVLGVASGLLSVGFGLFLVYEIGFVDGLLTSFFAWSPE